MPHDPSQLTAGLDVVAADGHHVGTVREVHDSHFIAHRRLQPDVAVPFDLIQDATDHGIVLVINASEVDDIWWTHAGEDMQVNLSGIYRYDYETP